MTKIPGPATLLQLWRCGIAPLPRTAGILKSMRNRAGRFNAIPNGVFIRVSPPRSFLRDTKLRYTIAHDRAEENINGRLLTYPLDRVGYK